MSAENATTSLRVSLQLHHLRGLVISPEAKCQSPTLPEGARSPGAYYYEYIVFSVVSYPESLSPDEISNR